jgi:penicillin-binding protein 1A
VGRLWFYVAIVRELPDFDKIKNGFSQTTNIVDRDGKTLYKVYDENRQYVPLSGISENVIHAIVAAEDKDFWTNQWVDFRGLMRAWVSAIVNRNLKWPGWSTITQQLIKNILLTNDKKITRKIKEIYLATRIDDYIRIELKKQNGNLTSKELDKATKGKILELYMNYIFLGNNAYGVEAASSTYFGKRAQDLGVLEASILASMPQSPSTLNPYRNADRLMGGLKITSTDTPDAIVGTGVLEAAKNQFIDAIKNSDRSIARSSDGVSTWLSARGSFKITVDGKEYRVEYTAWRKDYVLSRMYEDGYIDVAQVKEALIESQNYQFKSVRVDIRAPHFVFRVQEFLKSAGCEQKILPRCFTDEELAKWWLTIKTTLDGDSQEQAEKSINDNIATINGYGANNSSLLYVDSRDGDVLAYVWSADYNNQDIDGNVDMVQQPRQPWSSIKPLIYAYGFMNLPLTIDTTIYDLKFVIGKDTPNNNDGAFLGPMPIKRALWYSRNIPAIKMYFAVGWQDKLVPFLNDIGIASYDMKKDYGYPMAIGSAELKMMELTNAYMHLSAMGRPAKINPILEIRWADGQILYQKQPEQQPQIIPEGVAYLIWKILADTTNLPAAWVNNFFVRWLTYANKSGTTDMVDVKTGKKYPRDWWLAWYTPSKVALFWAGNTQGKPMNLNAYGWWVNGKTFRQFFTSLVKAGKMQSEDVSPIEVKNVTISKISWKLATDSTPETYKVATLGYINTLPSQSDNSFSPIQIDKACMGKVTDATPRYDIISTYLINPSTFMPNNMDLNDITNRFTAKVTWSGAMVDSGDAWSDQMSYANLLVKAPTNICENRVLLKEDASIQLTIRRPWASASIANPTNIWYDVTSVKPITSIRVLFDDLNIGEYTYSAKLNLSDIKTITLPQWTTWNHVLSVIAVNQDGGFAKQTVQISVVGQDGAPPLLLDDKLSVTKKWEWQYNVVMLFIDNEWAVRWGKISMTNGILLKKFDGNIVSLDIQIPQVLSYEVSDMAGNIKKWTIDVAKYVK